MPAYENTGPALTMTDVLPQYVSHKQVGALKIADVEVLATDTTTDENPTQVRVKFENPSFASRVFNLHGKPTPYAGWYYVLYQDGYESFSPAKQFEEGYRAV